MNMRVRLLRALVAKPLVVVLHMLHLHRLRNTPVQIPNHARMFVINLDRKIDPPVRLDRNRRTLLTMGDGLSPNLEEIVDGMPIRRIL